MTMRTPISRTHTRDGVELNYWEWLPEGRGATTAIFGHATGFHGRLWDQVIKRLPSDWRCIAMDFRGHGLSSAPSENAAYHWKEMVADTKALLVELDLTGVFGVGHSMGGCALAMAAAGELERFSKLALVDASIMDPQDATVPKPPGPAAGQPSISDGARRRRNQWASPAEMQESLGPKRIFRRWDADVLRDYCEHGLVPKGDGYQLACPPESEAGVFDHSLSVDPWPLLPALQLPVTVMRGQLTDGMPSTTSPRIIDVLPDVTDILVADCDHFIPMQRPDLVAEELVRAHGRG